MTEPTRTAAPTPWWELSGMEREIAKYDQCEEPGDCDHDHDNAIEYFREQELNGLRRERDDARAVALMLCEILREAPVGLDETIGEHIWGKLPDWFTGDNNGRDMWGGGDV